MKTINSYYKSKNSFQELVNKHKLQNQENILIQMFSSLLNINIIQKIKNEIISILPHAIIIGSTTDGEILDSNVTTNEMLISCSTFDKSTLKSANTSKGDLNDYEMGIDLANKLVSQKTKLLILFADGLYTNGEEFLKGINFVAPDIMIAGGLAGDGSSFTGTSVFTQDSLSQNGAVGVAVDSDYLRVNNSHHFGWQKIGPVMRIEKSDKNRVYKIDEKTPYEIYKYYLGENAADKLPAIGIEFPLIINRDGVDIARAVLGKNDDGSLVFAGNIAQGDTVQLGFGNVQEILKNTSKDELIIKSNTESIFIYSCMARRRFLQDDISIELEIFAKYKIPVSGFFTNGEFFKTDEKCELLNQTMTVVALSEKEFTSYDIQSLDLKCERPNLDSYQTDTITALSHLVDITSKELENLNINLQESVDKKTIELKENVEELERTTKTKSEFLANMSHEIRTPLNAIMGFIDIIKEKEQDKDNKAYLEIVKNSSDSLLGIINDVLDFSKIESGNMTLEVLAFDLKKLIREIGLLFYEKAKEKSIDIKIYFDKDLPTMINGDSLKFRQMTINLISNAIKFTPENGTVKMCAKYKQDSNELTFSIEDSGIGISPHNLQKIFDPFSQEDCSTTRRFGGTGLGLSICSSFVKLMGGDLKVSSTLGEGSKFYFTIPIVENKEISKTKKHEVLQEINFSFENKIILLVEDNVANQMFMKVILKKMNIDFELANDGIEAVAMFKKNRYDTVLMDENMPNMNGIEATRLIIEYERKKKLTHTPIIALTANALKGDKEVFLAAGMDEYLTKPVNKKKLNETLIKFLQ